MNHERQGEGELKEHHGAVKLNRGKNIPWVEVKRLANVEKGDKDALRFEGEGLRRRQEIEGSEGEYGTYVSA